MSTKRDTEILSVLSVDRPMTVEEIQLALSKKHGLFAAIFTYSKKFIASRIEQLHELGKVTLNRNIKKDDCPLFHTDRVDKWEIVRINA